MIIQLKGIEWDWTFPIVNEPVGGEMWTDVENDPITYTTDPLPSWLTFDAPNRKFYAYPFTPGDEGVHTINVYATDDINLNDHIMKSFTITITNLVPIVNAGNEIPD
jgi:hypothetical protein